MTSAAKIYIGNIPFKFPEDELKSLFVNFGEIVSSNIKEGFAFIEYAKENSAKEAIDAMHQKDLDGRLLRVETIRLDNRDNNNRGGRHSGFTTETNNIFVANMPNETTEDEFKTHFEVYGEVSHIKLLPPYPGRTVLSGFVDFVDLKSAIAAHDGDVWMGGNLLRTDYNARDKTQREDMHSSRRPRQNSPYRDDRDGRRRDDSFRDRRQRRSRSRSPPSRHRSSQRYDSPPRNERYHSESPPAMRSDRRSRSRSPRGRY